MIPKLLSGQMAASNDLALAQQLVMMDPNTKVIFVGDTIGYEEVIKNNNFVAASLLVPDYRIMEMDVNGQLNEFSSYYMSYLSSENPSMLLATIFLAMHQGKNILLFFPPQAEGLNYPMVLLNYLKGRFGITVSDGRVPFSVDSNLNYAISELMYTFNYITPQLHLIYTGNMITNARQVRIRSSYIV